MFRRLQLLVLSVVLIVAAFSTGYLFLFFLVYLGLLVGGGSYILTRLGLADLEAGYAVSQLSGHVGDRLRVTYTLRNTGRLIKPWLEVHNPTTLPGGLPGRALLAARSPGALVARAHAARPARPLPDRAAPDPDRRPVRLLRGLRERGPGDHARRVPAGRRAAAVAAATGQHRGRPRVPGADAADHAARDDRAPVRAGRLDEPDPLAHHRQDRRDPGQGVRPRADGGRVAVPRPRCRRARRATATTPRPRSPSAPRRRSRTRRWARTGPSA